MTTVPARFEGKRIAVIGVARGRIGGEIVERLSAEGASIVLGGRNRAHLDALAGSASGVRAVVPLDLADTASVHDFFDLAAEELGGLDGLANNAALYGSEEEDGDAVEADLDAFDRLLSVNLRGQLVAARAALPHLLESGGGSIVMTSSIAGVIGEPTRVSYGLAKAGILALTRHIAARWGKRGVRCNAVVPGRIVGPGPVPEEERAYLARMEELVATPRLGRPDDIAAAVAFLLSEDAGFVNGTHLMVDGGVSAVFAPAPESEADFIHRYPFSRSRLRPDDPTGR